MGHAVGLTASWNFDGRHGVIFCPTEGDAKSIKSMLNGKQVEGGRLAAWLRSEEGGLLLAAVIPPLLKGAVENWPIKNIVIQNGLEPWVRDLRIRSQANGKGCKLLIGVVDEAAPFELRCKTTLLMGTSVRKVHIKKRACLEAGPALARASVNANDREAELVREAEVVREADNLVASLYGEPMDGGDGGEDAPKSVKPEVPQNDGSRRVGNNHLMQIATAVNTQEKMDKSSTCNFLDASPFFKTSTRETAAQNMDEMVLLTEFSRFMNAKAMDLLQEFAEIKKLHQVKKNFQGFEGTRNYHNSSNYHNHDAYPNSSNYHNHGAYHNSSNYHNHGAYHNSSNYHNHGGYPNSSNYHNYDAHHNSSNYHNHGAYPNSSNYHHHDAYPNSSNYHNHGAYPNSSNYHHHDAYPNSSNYHHDGAFHNSSNYHHHDAHPNSSNYHHHNSCSPDNHNPQAPTADTFSSLVANATAALNQLISSVSGAASSNTPSPIWDNICFLIWFPYHQSNCNQLRCTACAPSVMAADVVCKKASRGLKSTHKCLQNVMGEGRCNFCITDFLHA
eukprot:maker-scaffold3758_size7581-snap-gene-0.1 protein:Tk06458 transcript:maker-scaffold3758_size7581-snap-gene-0.1-mRNA-1 annotation:"tpa: prion protein 2a 2a"